MLKSIKGASQNHFRPQHIASVGTFQDGSLLYKNPASIALHEAHRLWVSSRETERRPRLRFFHHAQTISWQADVSLH